MKKILLWNFILIFIVCFIIEAISYCAYWYKYKDAIQIQWQNGNKVILEYHIPYSFNPNMAPYNDERIRTFKKQSNKKPLCFVGCSYTEGSCLSDEETFAYKISQKTNRTVYLRGITATGLAYVYYQILHKTIPTDTEYIIYTYIPDHINRLFQYQLGFWSTEMNLRYEIKNGILQEVKNPFEIINSLYFVKLLEETLAIGKSDKEKQDYKLFKAIMSDMIIKFKQNYPNAKFVFLTYPENEEDSINSPKEIKDFVKSLGYIYLDANELSGENLGELKWKVKGEGLHPNTEAWDTVIPNFIKELKL